ncbi:HEPN domain-containing protein [Shewanella algae]|uniref:ApeA N-terminal domain 1-containing protein n=1 Tax=Shewanella algae TaxID=38313 RepID=UPI001AAD1BB6|nr:HEPN domain-containing protein [Shewanella algae]MBO2617004.1 hypothetical protein [Shewanella algae]
MRIKNIVKSGTFWLRRSPETKVSGEIQIDNGGEITLSLIGVLHEGLEVEKYFDVLGVVEGEKGITLQGCSYRRRSLFNRGVTTSIINAQRAIENGHFIYDEEPLFNEVSFSTDLLIEWLELSSISVKNNEENSSLVVKIFDPIKHLLPNGDVITVYFNTRGPSSRMSNRMAIEQVAMIRYTSKDYISLNDLLAKADAIRNFISLGIGFNVCFTDMLVHSKETQEIFLEKGLRVYFKDMNFRENSYQLYSYEMLFTYHEIKNGLHKFIGSWLELSGSEMDVIGQYFSVLSGKALNEEMGFLHFAQGLESLHSSRFQESGYLPELEFNSLLSLLVEAAPKEHSSWVHDKLKHGNNPPFSKRIKSLVNKYPETFGNSKQRKIFSENVFNARNILTHQGKEQLFQHLKSQTIVDVKNLVRVLYQHIFMELIGFEHQQSVKLLSKHKYTKSVLEASLPTT